MHFNVQQKSGRMQKDSTQIKLTKKIIIIAMAEFKNPQFPWEVPDVQQIHFGFRVYCLNWEFNVDEEVKARTTGPS